MSSRVYIVEIQSDVDIQALPGLYAFKDPLKSASLAKRILDKISKSRLAARKIAASSAGFFDVAIPEFDKKKIALYLKKAPLMTKLILSLSIGTDKTYIVTIHKTFLE